MHAIFYVKNMHAYIHKKKIKTVLKSDHVYSLRAHVPARISRLKIPYESILDLNL